MLSQALRYASTLRTPLELELGIVVCQLAGDASLVTDIVAEVAECGARHHP